MDVSTRQVNEVTIVDLSGPITLAEGSTTLRDTIKQLVGQGQKHVLLNLGKVQYLDSAGIGELVNALTRTRDQGGELKLLHLTQKVHDLLQVTKLYEVFDIRDDETAAIQAFSKSA
jgi:anti-sigma B factor antagonist